MANKTKTEIGDVDKIEPTLNRTGLIELLISS